MTAVVSPSFHHSIASTVYSDIQSRKSIYHYFVGNILSWEDESIPPETQQSSLFEKDTRNNMISSKQIQINDVSFIVPNNIWSAFSAYDMWDDDVSELNPTINGAEKTEDSIFYVVTEPDYNIYMCIYNNDGAPSTVAPSGVDIDYLETADGYVWKFMANIPLAFRNKFMTSAYIPVTRSIKNAYYLNGSIGEISIINGGIDYESTQVGAIIVGDGDGALVSVVLDELGTITDIVVDDPGTGYTYANLVVTKGALDLGSGADIQIDLTYGDFTTSQSDVELNALDGSLSYIVVADGGVNYTAATATIVGNGFEAIAEVVVVDGVVTRIPVLDYGYGYSYATVTITGDGTGAAGRVIIGTKGGHGKDLPAQLMSNRLCFYAFVGDETNQGLQVDNEYRKFGVIRNLTNFGSAQKFNSTNGSSCYLVTATTSIGAGILSGDMAIQSSSGVKNFRVVSFFENQVLIHSIDGSVPSIGDTYRNTLNEDVFDVDTVTNPSIDKFSGDLLFIENKTSFVPSEIQSVFLRSYIRL